VIIDDKFETVHSLPPDKPLDQQWAIIFCHGRECFADIDYDEKDNPILPPMSDIIKSYEKEKVISHVLNLSTYIMATSTTVLIKPTPSMMTTMLECMFQGEFLKMQAPKWSLFQREEKQQLTVMMLTMGFNTPVLAHATTSELANKGQQRYKNFPSIGNHSISVSSLMPTSNPTNKPSIIHGKS
jgi:hypothetical protein